jgi:hypothetical protein
MSKRRSEIPVEGMQKRDGMLINARFPRQSLKLGIMSRILSPFFARFSTMKTILLDLHFKLDDTKAPRL